MAWDTLAYACKLKPHLDACDLVVCHNYPSYYWAAMYRRISRRKNHIVWLCQEPYRAFYPDITESATMSYLLPSENERVVTGLFGSTSSITGSVRLSGMGPSFASSA